MSLLHALPVRAVNGLAAVLSLAMFATPPLAAAAPALGDVAAMQRHIDELEARLQKLEKSVVVAGGSDSPAPSGKSTDGAIKQRMSEIEARLQARFTEMEQSRVVRAPFKVVDETGKSLVTIDKGSRGNGARIVVGQPVGVSVTLAAYQDSASLQLIGADDLPKGAVQLRNGVASVFARGKLGVAQMGSVDGGPSFIQVLNKADLPVVSLDALPDSQSGSFTLTDASGTPVVMAGVTNKGTGSVKTGPKGNGPAALLGNAGKAASEIQGRPN